MSHFTNDNDNNPRRKVLSTLSNSQTKPIQTDLKSYFENQNRSNKPKLELEPSNDQKLFNPQQKNNEKQEKIEISNQNLYEQKLKQALKEAIDENEIVLLYYNFRFFY